MKLKQFYKQKLKNKRQSLTKHRRIAVITKRNINKEVQVQSSNVVPSLIVHTPVATPTSFPENDENNIYKNDNDGNDDDSDVDNDEVDEEDDDDNDVDNDEVDEWSLEHIVSDMDSESEQCKKLRILLEVKCTLREPMESHMSDIFDLTLYLRSSRWD